jgi:guanine deaminase
MTAKYVVRGRTVSFPSAVGCIYEAKGAIAIGDDGRILWTGPYGNLPRTYRKAPVHDYGQCLVMPGFIDAHIHFPQYRMLAAPGVDLLDWLNRFTYPEEARYADDGHAKHAAQVFLRRLFANGTTSALAFCSVHKSCAEALFRAAAARNMAISTGKTMMDRNADPAVLDDPDRGARESEELLVRWHGRGRARYALTPRFAITSSEAQLRLAGELLKSHPEALLQSHLSESAMEIATVKRLFPEDRDYTAVYDRFGLLGPRSFFAHGIHLSERECGRLHEAGSKIVHCPTSNTFLGSGLFDIARLRNPSRPVAVGLATDIGGGTSYSMLATMAEAYKVAMLRGSRLTAVELFHMATGGNAGLLGLQGEVGVLEQGAYADLVVLDPCATAVLTSRQELSQSLDDQLFALALLGDERAVTASYVAGKRVHHRAARASKLRI